MKTNFTYRPSEVIEILRHAGFVESPSSPEHITLRHPELHVTLTLPKGPCPLGQKIATRILLESGLLSPELVAGAIRASVQVSATNRMSLTELDRIERNEIV
jgi:hypothetical protein